jgi:hypothetical protein
MARSTPYWRLTVRAPAWAAQALTMAWMSGWVTDPIARAPKAGPRRAPAGSMCSRMTDSSRARVLARFAGFEANHRRARSATVMVA